MSIPTPRASRPAVGVRARSVAKVPSREGARIVVVPETATTAIAIAEALPDPSELPEGTLVILPAGPDAGAKSLAKSVLAVFGRKKTTPMHLRCTALVLRGYVDVGGAPHGEGDDAFGTARY